MQMQYEAQEKDGKPNPWLEGLVQAIVNEEEWPPVQKDIPDDHWVYLQVRKWLMERSDLPGPAIILNSGKGNRLIRKFRLYQESSRPKIYHHPKWRPYMQ